MKRNISLLSIFALVLLLLAAFSITAYASPSKSTACTSCHILMPSVTVTLSTPTCNGTNATYNITVSNTFEMEEGWAVFDTSVTPIVNVANALTATGTFTVAAGKTYDVYGTSDSDINDAAHGGGKGGTAKITINPVCALPACPDADNDGYAVCSASCSQGTKQCGDCLDTNANVNPGKTEGPAGNATCTDTLDNDCDTKTDSADSGCVAGCTDNDGDGYGAGCALGPDCNDNNAAINPGAAELCDGLDNNCNGSIDETFTNKGQSCSSGLGICLKTGTYVCSADKTTTVCSAVPGTPGTEGPAGNATCSDTLDNDCDGKTDAADSNCSLSTTPPPVRQSIGMPDKVFANMTETTCRTCHTGSQADRHHLANQTCSTCHQYEWNTSCACWVPVVTHDCMVCHKVTPGQGSVHHQTADAQAAVCSACHSNVVFDKSTPNVSPNHIPTYAPSLVTPAPGFYWNSNPGPNGEGSCDFCHAPGSDTTIATNYDTHHTDTGFYSTTNDSKCSWCHKYTGGFDAGVNTSDSTQIRACQNCHRMRTLHNIQADSNGGGVSPYNELAYYGHIGNNADCWGCHGFSAAADPAPFSGPIVPQIDAVNASTVTAGQTATLTITGQVLTNTVESPYGSMALDSNVVLTAADGSSMVITPASITDTVMVANIPALAAGNYDLRASKYEMESNPISIAAVPAVGISSAVCSSSTLTTSGSGFGSNPASGDAVVVKTSGRKGTGATYTCTISSWSDTKIVAQCTACDGTVTVKSIFGTASASTGSAGGGKKK